MLENGVKFLKLAILGGVCVLVTLVVVSLTFIPRYDVDKEYGKKNVELSLEGTWVHTNTLCRGVTDYSDIIEYTFGKDLKNDTINPIHLDKYNTSMQKASDEQRLWVMEWIENCEFIEKVEEDETVLTIVYDNYIREVTFLFIPERSLVLSTNQDGTFNFIPKESVMALPKYIGSINKVENSDRG